jgi:hypothetical protein
VDDVGMTGKTGTEVTEGKKRVSFVVYEYVGLFRQHVRSR